MSPKVDGRGTGVLFRSFLFIVAVSPRDLMGSLPMSLMVMVSATTDLSLERMEVMLQKPVHFCRNSEVMETFFGTVELTRSDGHSFGATVGRTVGDELGSGDWSSLASEVYSVGQNVWVIVGADPPCCGEDPPCSTGMWIVSMMGDERFDGAGLEL